MTTRRLTVITLLGATCAILAGCGGSGDSGDALPGTTPVRGSLSFALDNVGEGATVGGEARLEPVGTSRTRVVVDGIDESEPGGGGANPARLRAGTCETAADGKGYALQPLQGATSTTLLDVPLARLLAQPHHVEVLLPPRAGEPDEKAGAVIACGDVPSG